MFYVWRNRMGLKSKIKQYWLLFLENFMVAELQLFWVILRDFSLINCLVKVSGDWSYGQSLWLYVAAYFRFLYLTFPFHLWNYYNQQQKSQNFNSRFQQLLKTQPGPGEIFSRFRRDVEGITFEDRIESCIIILKSI